MPPAFRLMGSGSRGRQSGPVGASRFGLDGCSGLCCENRSPHLIHRAGTEPAPSWMSHLKKTFATPDPDVLPLIGPAQARRFLCVPLGRKDARLLVAIADPDDLGLIRDVEFLTGMAVEPVPADRAAIARAIDEHYPSSSLPLRITTDGQPAPSADVPIVRIQELIFQRADDLGASDIHIERGRPGPGCATVWTVS